MGEQPPSHALPPDEPQGQPEVLQWADSGAHTIAGPEKTNADRFFINKFPPIAVIADGMGSYGGDDVAAEIITEQAQQPQYFEKPIGGFYHLADTANTLWHRTKQRILEARAKDKNLEHMDTTATVVTLYADQGVKKIGIASTGDTRAYVIKRDGILEQLSVDHDLAGVIFQGKEFAELQHCVRDALDSATFEQELAPESDANQEFRRLLGSVLESSESPQGDRALFEERLKTHKFPKLEAVSLRDFWDRRNLTNGIVDALYGMAEHVVGGGDVGILLTTDGVHDNLTKKQMEDMCRLLSQQEIPAQQVAELLTTFALRHSQAEQFRSKPGDDITAVVLSLR